MAGEEVVEVEVEDCGVCCAASECVQVDCEWSMLLQIAVCAVFDVLYARDRGGARTTCEKESRGIQVAPNVFTS